MTHKVQTSRKAASRKAVQDTFFRRYGRAIAVWAEVEQALSLWFIHLCSPQREKPQLLQSVFYAPSGFRNSADLLKAAFSIDIRNEDVKDFFDEAMIRTDTYSKFRNRLAHNVARYVHEQNIMILYVPKHLLQPKDPIADRELVIATRNFKRLAYIWMYSLADRGRTPRLTPREALARIETLLSQAHSSAPSRRQSGRLRQLRARNGSRG